MLVNSISVNNPVVAIKKTREYRQHLRFPIEWNLLSNSDRQLYREIFGADESQPRISLIVPIVNGYLEIDKCKLHRSFTGINPSFDAICRVDEYVLLNGELPDCCGINVKLSGEEKVNLMCLVTKG